MNFLKNLFYGLASALLITMMFVLIFYALLFLPIGFNSLTAGVLSTIITGIIVVVILKEQKRE